MEGVTSKLSHEILSRRGVDMNGDADERSF